MTASETIGQYASDAILYEGDERLDLDPDGTKDVRGTGNIGFHSSADGETNLFGQNDDEPSEAENVLGYGEDVQIIDPSEVDVKQIAIGARTRRERLDTTMTDEWMKKHGFKW